MQLLVNILISTSLFALTALSFQVIYQTTKFFHIAHAVVITLGAYFVYCFNMQLELPMSIAVILSILSSTCFALILEYTIYKPLRRIEVKPFMLMIASLGIYTVLLNLVTVIWKADTKSFRQKNFSYNHEIFGAYITNIQIVTIITYACLLLFVVALIHKTQIGKKIQAVSTNEQLSNILGIDSSKIILITFLIGSALGSLVGILYAADLDMSPTMGFNLLIYGLAAMIIGGIGKYSGIVWGALLLASAQHLGAYFFDSRWMDFISYLILILFLIWKPLGFSGQRLKKNTL